jgi:hypothetical protein
MFGAHFQALDHRCSRPRFKATVTFGRHNDGDDEPGTLARARDESPLDIMADIPGLA